MDQNKKNIGFQIDGLFKLKKVGDYLKLVDKKVKLVLKETDSGLSTRIISKADVAGLSDTGTHLILKNLCIKRFFFFSKHITKHNLPIDNIAAIHILETTG